MAAINAVPTAKDAWEKLSKTGRYMIIMKLANVRTPAGRERNIQRAVERLATVEAGSSEKTRTTMSRAQSKKVSVVAGDARPSPSPVTESRAERAERRAKRLGKGKERGSS